MNTCTHMPERLIVHETSGVNQDGAQYHTPGDRVVLQCPHGCADIIINVVQNPPDLSWFDDVTGDEFQQLFGEDDL